MKRAFILFVIVFSVVSFAADCRFTDVSAARGLANVNGMRISTVDVNNDGYPDIFFCSSTNKPYLYLYNPATKQYDDVTASSGIGKDRRGGTSRFCTGGLFTDIDNDGDLDMLSIIFFNRINNASKWQAWRVDSNDILVNQLSETGKLSFNLALHPPFSSTTETDIDLTSAVFCDYDKDGITDLFVGSSLGGFTYDTIYFRSYKQQLWQIEFLDWNNDGIKEVTISTDELKIDDPLYDSVYFAEWDTLPDWPNISDSIRSHPAQNYLSSRLLKGTGNIASPFIDVTQGSGIGSALVSCWAVSAMDFNGDGLIDLCSPSYKNVSFYPINSGGDTSTANKHSILWKNNGNGTFSQVQTAWAYDKNRGWDCHKSSFGSMPRDFNNDGREDLLEIILHGDGSDGSSGVVIPSHTQILYNTGSAFNWDSGYGAFGSRYADDPHTLDNGLGHYDIYGSWIDINNDGLADVAINDRVNNAVTWFHSYIFQQAPTHQFFLANQDIGLEGLLQDGSSQHNITPLDYDQDGDEDLLMSTISSPNHLILLENTQTNANTWIKTRLKGVKGRSNVAAIGAVVEITTPSLYFRQTVSCGDGHQLPQRPLDLNFGLGPTAPAQCTVTVKWTDSKRSIAKYFCPTKTIVALNEADVAPRAPARLAGAHTSQTRIQLRWNDSSSNETGFWIERRTKGGSNGFSVIGSASANSVSYADSSVLLQTVYQYRVRTISQLRLRKDSSGVLWNFLTDTTAYSNIITVLPDPTISVVSPFPGVPIHTDTTTTIGWLATGTFNTIAIHVSLDSGRSWIQVAESAPNTGDFQWMVPDTVAPNAMLRLTIPGVDSPAVTSTVRFSILRINNAPVITAPDSVVAVSGITMFKFLVSDLQKDTFSLRYPDLPAWVTVQGDSVIRFPSDSIPLRGDTVTIVAVDRHGAADTALIRLVRSLKSLASHLGKPLINELRSARASNRGIIITYCIADPDRVSMTLFTLDGKVAAPVPAERRSGWHTAVIPHALLGGAKLYLLRFTAGKQCRFVRIPLQ